MSVVPSLPLRRLGPGRVLLGTSPPEALAALLAPGEDAPLARFPAEKRRLDWLHGRAAAKLAALDLLAAEVPALDPTGVRVVSGPQGAPSLRLPGRPLAVSLSHGHGRAAAYVLPPGREGGLPGIDLEQVRARPSGTLRFYLHPDERAWVEALPAGEDGRAGPRDRAAVLLWALKEAAFKALQPPRGAGLLDVSLRLSAAWDAEQGTAEVRYAGRCAELARERGATGISASWTTLEDDLVLAWVVAHGATLPPQEG